MAQATIDLSGLLTNIEATTWSAAEDLAELIQVKDAKIDALVKAIEAKNAQVEALIHALRINNENVDALTETIRSNEGMGGVSIMRDQILGNDPLPPPSSTNSTDGSSKRPRCVAERAALQRKRHHARGS